MAFTVIGFGEVLWDVFRRGRRLGGAPANFCYHAHRLGLVSYMVSRVGGDGPGRDIIAGLGKRGLSTDYIQTDPRHPTGRVVVDVDASGSPLFTIEEGSAWDHVAFPNPTGALCRRADAICFGSLAQRGGKTRASLMKALKAAKPGCLRVFDINIRQQFYSREVIEDSLRLSDVLKLNEDELAILKGLFALPGGERQSLRSLLGTFGLRLIALTKGERGSVLHTADGPSFFEGRKVAVADTVGAGDAFTAALVYGLLNGKNVESIGAGCTMLASHVCTRKGGMPPVEAGLLKRIREA